MYKVEFFDQFGSYKNREFNNKNDFMNFLNECQQKELQVLDFTEHYDPNND